MVPVSWFLIAEPKLGKTMQMREYLGITWELMKSRAMFYVIFFQFTTAFFLNVQTPATGEVKQYWAGVKNLQAQMFAIAGNLLFIAGLGIVKRRLLHVDWRLMLIVSQAALQFLDMPFQFLTIFNVFRNQYFYLGEAFLLEIPDGINFVVATYAMLCYAMLCYAMLCYAMPRT
jgi:hypothetical protein